jgi:hypothetical protein
MPEPVETYSTSSHLFTDLDIPTTVAGRLPLGKRTRAGLGAEYVDEEGDRKPRRGEGGTSGRRRRVPVEGEATSTPPRRSRRRTRSGRSAEGAAAETAPPGEVDRAEGSGRRRRRRRGGSRPAGEQAGGGE